MISLEINNIAMITVKVIGNRCAIYDVFKPDAISSLKGSVLDDTINIYIYIYIYINASHKRVNIKNLNCNCLDNLVNADDLETKIL